MRIVIGFQEGCAALTRNHLTSNAISNVNQNENPDDPEKTVTQILSDIRSRGDAAVFEYSKKFDDLQSNVLEIPKNVLHDAYRDLPRTLKNALAKISERATAFHTASLPKSWMDFAQGYGEKFTPLSRIGIYIPGGSAVYPSTVLMTAIPARVAGVNEIILATPSRGTEGPHPTILAAAYISKVDRVFQIGGAQAIGAMAYGTASIPKVEMVCGPGNLFVTIAKRMVYGDVAVDGLYGPTETVIIADEDSDPKLCASDLLAQAEHDPLASPIFITTSLSILSNVQLEIENQVSRLPRETIARTALETRGIAVLVDTLQEAVILSNLYAPEHLCLSVKSPWSLLGDIKNAGGVFIGEGSPEAVGDYVAGPSHVMPTGGTSRFNSPLGVHHFLKVNALIGLNRDVFNDIAPDGINLARNESFEGHARALEFRLNPKRSKA